MTLKQFAQNLRYLRREKKLSQQGLGKKIFASRSLIAHIERGSKVPSLAFAMKVCEYFSTDLNSITLTDMSKCA